MLHLHNYIHDMFVYNSHFYKLHYQYNYILQYKNNYLSIYYAVHAEIDLSKDRFFKSYLLYLLMLIHILSRIEFMSCLFVCNFVLRYY